MNVEYLMQWKPLCEISLGPTEENRSHYPNDNNISDHIKRLPLYIGIYFLVE